MPSYSTAFEFRADRLATLYFFYWIKRRGPRLPHVRIPILMYHSIGEASGRRVHPYYETRTAVSVLARHMKFLADHHYSVIGLDEVAKRVSPGARWTAKCVAITFDDGYQDVYTHAFPILKQYGFTATVFLPTAYIGRVPKSFNGKECLIWSEVRELHRAGIIFGSHTVSHPELKSLSTSSIAYEVAHSKKVIEEEIGDSIRSFSCPYAFPEHDRAFVRELRALLEINEYDNGVSTIVGRAGRGHERFFLPRLPMNTFDDLSFFQAKLEGAYDWIHIPQHLFKTVKKLWFLSRSGTDLRV